MKRLALLLTLLTGPAPGGAGSFVEDPVILVDYGILCPFPDERGRLPAPLTESGEILLIDQNRKIDIRSTIVPAVTDFSFGVRFRLQDGAELDGAMMFIEHPPLGETGLTRQMWPTAPTDGASTLDLFRFEFEHEKVPGLWVLGLMAGGRVLMQQEFQVVAPEDAPDLVEACDGPALLS